MSGLTLFMWTVQDCPVEDLLCRSRQTKGPIAGQDLVAKLQADNVLEPPERRFLVKTLGRYLMNNCSR